MSYTKQTWSTGDTVTASKLNHMEDGIAGAGGFDAEVLIEGDGEGNYTGTIISGTYASLSDMLSNDTVPLVRFNFINDGFYGVSFDYDVELYEGTTLQFTINGLGSTYICGWEPTDTLNVSID